MYGKQWNGRGYLDCQTQFGDAPMVQDFSRFLQISFFGFFAVCGTATSNSKHSAVTSVAVSGKRSAAYRQAKLTATGERNGRRRV